MAKRKLCAEDTPREQYAVLQKLTSLQASDRRAVIQLLNENGRGGRTTTSLQQQHKQTFPHLEELFVEGLEADELIPLWVLSVPGMVQEKINACHLYKQQMKHALKKNKNELTLIFYSDEVHAGNVLAPKHPRKANVTYIAFLEQDVLFLDNMWLTISVVFANEAQKCKHAYCSVIRKQLEFIRCSTKDGFPLHIDEECVLAIVKKVLILGDHDGLRSLSGAKGAAGLKPCLKCQNILSLGREAREHSDITECDVSKCSLQTQAGFREIVEHLQALRTKKDLAEAETLTGWNLSAVLHSCLTSPLLEGWVTLDSLYFDVMHQYWSCGMIAEELGLWYAAISESGIDLKQMRQWIALGWKSRDKRNPALLFDDKLWRIGADFRGDAAACAAALPLCFALSEEMLRAHFPELEPQITSLRHLYSVVLCIQWMKQDVSHVNSLRSLQRQHMLGFIRAYTTEAVRPKMHFALHTEKQARDWNRLIDTFV